MSDNRSKRILAVDDEDGVLRFVRSALTHFGYEVVTATGGALALELDRHSGPFDLLLTDLLMPNMRGDELALKMHAVRPGIRILYMTGYPQQLFQSRSKLDAHESLVEKPVTIDELHAAVQRALA